MDTSIVENGTSITRASGVRYPDFVLARNLDGRHLEVTRLVAAGYSNKEIASRLGITEATVKVHLKALLAKLHLGNRTQLAVWFVSGHDFTLPTVEGGLESSKLDILRKLVASELDLDTIYRALKTPPADAMAAALFTLLRERMTT